LSIFALLRTISEIIGRPPSDEAATFATPTASRSRFMSVLRRQGSSRSIALAESNDSTLPTSANITTHQTPDVRVAAEVKTEKSGVVTAAARLPGTLTRNDSPIPNQMPSGTATASTSSWAGIIRSQAGRRRVFTSGRPNRIARLTRPITVIWGLKCAIFSGSSRRISSGSPEAFWPNTTGICLRQMMKPIAASMPCTTAVGKNSLKAPARSRPKATCTTPATQPTASAIR
jgi:hypothetical protein